MLWSGAVTGSLPSHVFSSLKYSFRIVPVDIYVPGCPPTAEALMYVFLHDLYILYIKLIRETQVRIPAAPEESEEDAERTGLVQDLNAVQ